MAPSLSQRIGAASLSPAWAARRLCASGPGGVPDALLLLLLRVLGTQGKALLKMGSYLRDEGIYALRPIAELLLASARLDLMLILLGGVLLSLLLGKDERLLRPGVGVHLTAQAWIGGWLPVQLAAELAFALSGRAPGVLTRRVVQGTGLVLFLLLWGVALREARRTLRRLSGEAGAGAVHESR